jgi:hypothetical protein
MSKNAQVDLLPWIFGGLLIAVAVPAVMALTGGTKETPQAPRVVTMASDSVNTVPVPIRPASLPAAVAPVAPESATQIWQCVSNGQKTFSDSPCGADATVHQLSEINRMDAVPVSHTTAYSAYPSLNYAAAPPDQDAPDVDGGYSTSQFIVISERERREHSHRARAHESRAGRAAR